MDVHGGRTDSAVLVPLFCDPQQRLHAVFTKKSSDLRRHAGEISFPGGRKDDEDATLQDTALRETFEEIGLPASEVDVVGALAPVGTFVTNYAIYPFVGLIEHGFEWVRQEAEVAEVLELSFDDLMPATRSSAWCGAEWPSRRMSTRWAPTWCGGPPRESSGTCSSVLALLDRHVDQVAPLGPRAVVVLDVLACRAARAARTTCARSARRCGSRR